MNIAEFFSNRSSFESKEAIVQCITGSKYYDPTVEKPLESGALIIFMTARQHTWLVCSEARLYCVLDDLDKPNPHINWSLPKASIISEGKVSLPLRIREKNRNTGLIDIGEQHKGWLFSKKIFVSRRPIDTMIRKLIARQMIYKEHAGIEEDEE